MKSLFAVFTMLCLVCLFAVPVFAQDTGPNQYVAAGVAFNQYAAPNISGNLLYAKQISGGTYSFSMVDIVSQSIKPFTASTSITSGLAQKLTTLGPAGVYAVTTIGTVIGAQDVSYSWTGGGAVAIRIGKGWSIMPSVRVLKTGLTDFQGIYGLAIGWGK